MNIVDVAPHTRLQVKAKGAVYEGLLLPAEGKTIVLKLDNGYNVGLIADHIDDVEVLQTPVEPKFPETKLVVEQDKGLPTVKVLHTGGTIASRIDYKTGGVVAKFDPAELIGMFPELTQIAHIQSALIRNMQSDDFRFAHFNVVAKAVLEETKKGVQRFIVTCGTDFLHYLAAALSFLLKDTDVGVLVVGAQRSSDRGSSDSSMNLACATAFLASQSFRGVGVCLHASTDDDTCHVIDGTHVRKMHSSRRDAFKPINDGPLATVDFSSKKVDVHQHFPTLTGKKQPASLPWFKEDVKVGMIYAHPQMFPEEFDAFESFDGVLLVGSGLGHFPITKFDEFCGLHEQILAKIKGLAEKVPVAIATQTINGRVHLNVYSPQRVLRAAGVIGHLSVMHPETAYIKLAWLLSNYDPERVKQLFMTDIVGELNGDESNLYW